MKIKKVREHYVSNKDFTAAVTKHVIKCKENVAIGLPKPRLNNYIGECIMKLATRIANKPNFIGYSYKDEMISDGVETSVRYIDRFNPDKSDNAFAYCTMIIHNAFIRRIKIEKDQANIKNKVLEKMDIDIDLCDVQKGDTTNYSNVLLQSSLTIGLQNVKDEE